MRLIDADALRDRFPEPRDYRDPAQVFWHITGIWAEIDCSETVEPERKTGKWIWDENGMDWNLGAWKCDQCRTKAETWWATQTKVHPLRCSGGNYCGVCGAKMEAQNV